MPFRPIDEVPVSVAHATVYEEGWQSWSATTSYGAGETSSRPKLAWQKSMRFRSGKPLASTGFQAEALLVADPGKGEPSRV